jgi:DNA-binding PadR family transcriptional regulator
MFYDTDEYGGRGRWALWMTRHGARGFRRFGGGFMGGSGRGGAFHAGRKLGAADLQLLILALLAERASHGYELIKILDERSGGFYSPSPGMIYPALTYLEEIGYATVEAEGAKKRYQITDAGQRHLQDNRSVADAMLAALTRIGSRMEDVRRVFGKDSATEDSEEGERSGEKGADAMALYAAHRALRSALRQKARCSAQEARRITEILQHATAEIRKK